MDPIWFYYFVLAVLGTPYRRDDAPCSAPAGVDEVFWRSICNAIHDLWCHEDTFSAVPRWRRYVNGGITYLYCSNEDLAAYLARWHPP